MAPSEPLIADLAVSDDAIVIRGDRKWVDTGIHVSAGKAVTIVARGKVTLSRHMLLQDSLAAGETDYAPDLVVTARHGRYFRTRSTPGTTHGYPLAESMRATWFVSGPNIRRGARIDTPCRLVDLAPTILDMLKVSFDANRVDGQPIKPICQPTIETCLPPPPPPTGKNWTWLHGLPCGTNRCPSVNHCRFRSTGVKAPWT